MQSAHDNSTPDHLARPNMQTDPKGTDADPIATFEVRARRVAEEYNLTVPEAS